jgi:hypothetical protein
VCVCVHMHQPKTIISMCFYVWELKSHQGSCCLEAKEQNSSHNSVIWPYEQVISPLWELISSFVNEDDNIWTN